MKTIGLTNGETKVYSAILHSGIANINKIHEKTGLERRAIYDIINKLIKKGIVSYTIEKGKRVYQCAPINKLKQEVNKRKDKLKEFENKIPDIEKIYKEAKPDINVEIFRGKEGIKSIFEDLLNHKKCYFIGGRWYILKEMPIYWKNFNKRRIKKKVEFFNLILHDSPKNPSKQFLYTKTLPKEFSGAPSIIFIYGNKVVNILWGNDYFAFMLESKEIASNYKKYHKYLWDKIAK